MTTALPKEELRAIFVTLSGLPESRVIWDGESKGYAGKTTSGKTGHLVLDLVATRRNGVDEEKREYDVDINGVLHTRITYAGHRVRTVSVRAENYDAEEGYDLIEQIRLGLGQDDTDEALMAAGLALNSTEDGVNIGGSAGNRAVSFASLDVLFNQCVSREVLIPENQYIDCVEVTAYTEALTEDVALEDDETLLTESSESMTTEQIPQGDLAIGGKDTIGPP